MNSNFATRSARTLLAAGIAFASTLGIASQAQAGPGLCAPQPTPSITRSASPSIFHEHESSKVTISLSNPSCTTVSVYFYTSAETAKPFTDYVPVSKTFVFNPGETVKSVTIYGVNDKVQEGLEQFKINLSNPTGATIASPTGTLFIDGVEPQ